MSLADIILAGAILWAIAVAVELALIVCFVRQLRPGRDPDRRLGP